MGRRAIPITFVIVLAVAGCSSDGKSRSAKPGATSTTTRSAGGVGAPGIGDPYFPDSGNGGYDVTHYDLRIAYTPTQPEIWATATLDSVAGRNLDAFNLDFSGLRVDGITVGGRPAKYSRSGDELTIKPRSRLAKGTRYTTTVRYHGVPHTVTDPSESAPPEAGQLGWTRGDDGNVFVVSEPIGARTWFPSNDHPADKATFDITVDVPDSVAVASNGALTQGPVHEHRRAWHWSMDRPMATYLATVVIAPMREQQTRSPAGVTIRNYFPTDSFDANSPSFAKTGAMIDYFATLFGPYPFGQYGAVVVKPELGYALETQTMSLFGSDMLGTDSEAEMTVAHELAHQWFGDSVGIRRWADIWLNEGWATYSQLLWAAHADPAIDLNRVMVNLRASEAKKLTPPNDPGADGLFTTAIYDRGALALHALRRTVGDQKFFEIARQWNMKYRYGTATTAEFVALANTVAGRDLTEFLHSWLDANTVPVLP